MRAVVALALVLVVSACARVESLGATLVEERRQMNDLQARGTMAAMCDISVGSYFRELSEVERRLVALVCGGQFPDAVR